MYSISGHMVRKYSISIFLGVEAPCHGLVYTNEKKKIGRLTSTLYGQIKVHGQHLPYMLSVLHTCALNSEIIM